MNAATMELLLAKGLSGKDLLEVARAMEAKADPTNAQRQSRLREKRKAERNGVTVTRYAPPKEKKSNPPEPICSDEQNPLPEWLPEKPWAEFVEMRRSMGKTAPFTTAAERNIVAKLGKLRSEGHDPAELLNEAVARGWRGVFAPETKAKATGPPSFLDHLVETGAAHQ